MSKGNRGDGAWEMAYAPFLNAFKKNNPTNNSQQLNERMYLRILGELACNRFKWIGMPDTVSIRWMELTLFQQGLAVFYWDDDFNRFLVLKGTGASPLDYANDPTRFQVYGNQMVQKSVYPWRPDKIYNDEFDEAGQPIVKGHPLYRSAGDSLKDCVPIWANYMRMPDQDIVLLYSRKLAMLDRTIEILGQNMRVTKVMASGENDRLSAANFMRMVDEGVAWITVSEEFDMDKIQALDLSPHPDLIERAQLARTRLWNECMGLLGINNANQDKKERLVSDEVSANDEQVEATKNIALNERKHAAAMINARWDLSISVNFNTDLQIPAGSMIASGEF